MKEISLVWWQGPRVGKNEGGHARKVVTILGERLVGAISIVNST